MDGVLAIIAVIFGLAFPLAAAAVLLGWLVPLIMGITRRRRGRGGGKLIVLGSVWGVVAAVIVTGLAYTISTFSTRYTPEEFSAAEYSGETGQIVVWWNGPCELTLQPASGGRMLHLSSDNGQLTAPAGRHRIASWELKATDRSGREWSATGRPGYDWPEHQRTVNVQSDTPARINVGWPLRAHIGATADSENVYLDFTLTGSDGAAYTLSGPGSDAPPKFEMVDSTGRVVLSGDFEYG